MIAVGYFCKKSNVDVRKKYKSTVPFYTNNFLTTTITPYLISNLAVCIFWVPLLLTDFCNIF